MQLSWWMDVFLNFDISDQLLIELAGASMGTFFISISIASVVRFNASGDVCGMVPMTAHWKSSR